MVMDNLLLAVDPTLVASALEAAQRAIQNNAQAAATTPGSKSGKLPHAVFDGCECCEHVEI